MSYFHPIKITDIAQLYQLSRKCKTNIFDITYTKFSMHSEAFYFKEIKVNCFSPFVKNFIVKNFKEKHLPTTSQTLQNEILKYPPSDALIPIIIRILIKTIL